MKINTSDRPPSSKWRKNKKKKFMGLNAFQRQTMYSKQRQPKQIHNRAHIFILMAIYQLEIVWLFGFFFHYTPCLIIRFSFTAYLAHLASRTFKNRYSIAQFITRNAFHSRTVANLWSMDLHIGDHTWHFIHWISSQSFIYNFLSL